MDVLYKIIHMYIIAQHSPNPLYYVHKNLFRGGVKATYICLLFREIPLPLSGDSIFTPLEIPHTIIIQNTLDTCRI